MMEETLKIFSPIFAGLCERLRNTFRENIDLFFKRKIIENTNELTEYLHSNQGFSPNRLF